MKILGIDPGTRLMGYAIIQAPSRYLECGVLRAKPKDPLNVRLLELTSSLREIIEEFEPDALAIERAFHGVNAASSLKLAEARGAFKLVGLENGLPIHEYAPATIKKRVTGRGRATKKEIQIRVKLLCRLASEPPQDAADALAIALCHAASCRVVP